MYVLALVCRVRVCDARFPQPPAPAPASSAVGPVAAVTNAHVSGLSPGELGGIIGACVMWRIAVITSTRAHVLSVGGSIAGLLLIIGLIIFIVCRVRVRLRVTFVRRCARISRAHTQNSNSSLRYSSRREDNYGRCMLTRDAMRCVTMRARDA
jgi:hypothetical protein